MLLTGDTLARVVEQTIFPHNPNAIKGASYDVHLGRKFVVFESKPAAVLDSHTPDSLYDIVELGENDWIRINPGEFMLAQTREVIKLPGTLAARVEGKSSVGRRGQFVHVTAGFIDPGFEGNITLELYNARQRPQIWHVGDPIAQVCYFRTTDFTLYNGKYMGEGVEPSQYHLNFSPEARNVLPITQPR